MAKKTNQPTLQTGLSFEQAVKVIATAPKEFVDEKMKAHFADNKKKKKKAK